MMFDIREAVVEISGPGRGRESLAEFGKKRGSLGDFPRMKRTICNITAGASDSGFAEIGLRNCSVFLLKSLGVTFSYRDGKLSGHSYFPSKGGKREIAIVKDLDEAESRILMELKRLRSEWDSLAGAIEAGCDIALFDGSLVPLPSAVPKKGSGIYREFEKLSEAIGRARAMASKKGTVLAGMVKDSRSSRLCGIIGMECNDSVLMEGALAEGEATPPLPYSEERKDVLFSYMKTGRDLVFRIEWFSDYLESPLQTVYSLCGVTGYGYPPPLVEADLRASIRKSEFEAAEKSIKSRFPGLVRMRERRPFRR